MRILSLALCTLLLLSACGGEPNEELPPLQTSPERVEVDHILIAVDQSGVPGGLPIAEASKLAAEVWKEVQDGGDWAKLKEKYSNDRPPKGKARGPYGIYDDLAGVHQARRDEMPRGRSAKFFGDLSFTLRVGEMGMANYHPQDSPFGWHIIKRVK